MAKAKQQEAVLDEEILDAEIEISESEILESEGDAEDDMEETDAEAEDTAAPAEDLAITQEDVRLVEAVLFASSSAVAIGQIAERFPEERVSLIPDILEVLRGQYENRGVNLVQRAGKWALRTSSDLGDALRLEKEQPKKFTRAAMETLAVVAYHQPVTRAEVENIRGVATSPGALDALLEAGWIKPGKRREVPGRPVTWLTTQEFLDHFGLEKLQDLPGMDDLKAAGLLDKRPAIEAMPTPDLFDGEGVDHLAQEVTNEDLIGQQDITEGDDVLSEGEDNPETALDTSDIHDDIIVGEDDAEEAGDTEAAFEEDEEDAEDTETAFEEDEAGSGDDEDEDSEDGERLS